MESLHILRCPRPLWCYDKQISVAIIAQFVETDAGSKEGYMENGLWLHIARPKGWLPTHVFHWPDIEKIDSPLQTTDP